MVSAVLGLLCEFTLRFFPRKWIMWTDKSKLYRHTPPPWSGLSKIGKTIQVLFYFFGVSFLLLLIVGAFVMDK